MKGTKTRNSTRTPRSLPTPRMREPRTTIGALTQMDHLWSTKKGSLMTLLTIWEWTQGCHSISSIKALGFKKSG